jgi:putative membrane protein
MEMEAGGLAAARGQSAKVKKYGEQLIKDHRQADDAVLAFAKKKSIDLEANAGPNNKGSDEGMGKDSDESSGEQPEQARSASMDRLRTLNGAEFDDAFLTQMVSDHEDAIRMVRNARSQTQDAELRALLNKLLPVLQQHHDLAQRLLNGTHSG